MSSTLSNDFRGDRFFSNKDKKLFLRSLGDTVDLSLEVVGDVEITDSTSDSFTSTDVLILESLDEVACRFDERSKSGSIAIISMLGNVAVGEEDGLGATRGELRWFVVLSSFCSLEITTSESSDAAVAVSGACSAYTVDVIAPISSDSNFLHAVFEFDEKTSGAE